MWALFFVPDFIYRLPWKSDFRFRKRIKLANCVNKAQIFCEKLCPIYEHVYAIFTQFSKIVLMDFAKWFLWHNCFWKAGATIVKKWVRKLPGCSKIHAQKLLFLLLEAKKVGALLQTLRTRFAKSDRTLKICFEHFSWDTLWSVGLVICLF